VETSTLHEERLETVLGQLLNEGVQSVLDLGCGNGDFLLQLAARKEFKKIVGIDVSRTQLAIARQRIEDSGLAQSQRIILFQASFTQPDESLQGYDAAALVETIEHLPPNELSAIESTVFRFFNPKTIIITTPNAEFNKVHNVPAHRFRHPDHYFEWPRYKFQKWANGVASRTGYSVEYFDIGFSLPSIGSSTQMAKFKRLK